MTTAKRKVTQTASPAANPEAEIARLNKIITALMDRAERSMDHQGSDFGLFQTALTLEAEVNQRTRELGKALDENEQITRSLYRLTESLQAEIQQRRQAEALRSGQYQILEMIAAKVPLTQLLLKLAEWVEQQGPNGLASIVLLDDEGAAIAESLAPSLPEDYNQALVGVTIGENRGSCGTAMYRNKAVEVTDIQADPLWADFRDLAGQFGLRACWSTPITTSSGQVLGSFAIYYRQPGPPSEQQKEVVASAVHLAGIAIERAQAEAKIQFMAHHDELTGLPNRVLLQERINSAIAEAAKNRTRTTVLMIDLDRFKHVNDSLGHHTGDLILKEVAQRLTHCIRSGDTIARLGGDEFVINVQNIGGSYSPAMVATRVMQQLETPFFIRNKPLQLGASIGISCYPGDGTNAHDLLRTADTAMYAAKKSGRNRYQYFTEELNVAAHEHIVLLTQLQGAIRNNEFKLHYQPLYDLDDDHLVGAEALLRWQHPERGLLAPGQFLDLLEEHGLMADVGTWVLRTACAQAAEWIRQGYANFRISINLAADQFYRGDLVPEVQAILAETRLPAECLMLEFTESVLLRDSDAIITSMNQLKKLGVQLSLDDFGTGYSSLSYLHSFPVDQLKIDRSFVERIHQTSSSMDIVTSIVQLAKTLGMRSVAEGLETETQKAVVKGLHCDEGQGYLLGRPSSVEAFNQLLEEQARPDTVAE